MHIDSHEALGVLNTVFEILAPSSLRPVDMLLRSMFVTPSTMVSCLIHLQGRANHRPAVVSGQSLISLFARTQLPLVRLLWDHPGRTSGVGICWWNKIRVIFFHEMGNQRNLFFTLSFSSYNLFLLF